MIVTISERAVSQITAGQIVLSLASALKELIENALDAHTSSIDIRMYNYGKDGFTVSDKGDGIEPEDFPLVCVRHATSKLSDFNELSGVRTLGFRGEALAALCAMAEVEITTSTGAEGHRLQFDESGKLISDTVCALPRGTSVSVRNLFRLLPVRRKDFERRYKNEYRKAVDVVQAYSLISPITVTMDNTANNRKIPVLRSSGKTIKERIACIFGARAAQTLLDVAVKTDEVRLEGCIGTSENREFQLLYINKRPCDFPRAARVVEEAFSPQGGHSRFVLDLQIPVDSYDVNVSPDKRKILLHNESKLLETLRKMVETLVAGDRQLPFVPPAKRPCQSLLSLERFRAPNTEQCSATPESPGDAEEPEHLSEGSDVSEAEAPESSFETARKAFVSSTPQSPSISSFSSEENLPLSEEESETEETVAREDKARASVWNRQSIQTPQSQSWRCAAAKPFSSNVSSGKPGLEEACESSPCRLISENERGLPPEACAMVSTQESININTPESLHKAQMGTPFATPDHANRNSLGSQKLSQTFYGETLNTHISTPVTMRDVVNAMRNLPEENDSQSIKVLEPDNKDAEHLLQLKVSKTDFAEMIVIGQFNKGFILVRKPSRRGSDLFVIDQHASDEIYNFERLQRTTILNRQPLVQSRVLELSAVEEHVVVHHLHVFENNGFSISVDPDAPPGRRCSLAAIPFSKSTVFDEKDIHEIIYRIKESGQNARCSKLRAMFAMRACRSSVMIGTALDMNSMERIVSNLGKLDKPWNCPHGRPTLRHITSLGRPI